MKCDVCCEREAMIYINNEKAYCLECHNEKMFELMDMDVVTDYPKEMMIRDQYGEAYHFEISYILYPMYFTWQAESLNSNYSFEVSILPEDDKIRALKCLFTKMVAGVEKKTLELLKSDDYIDNAIHIEGKQYQLQQTTL